MIDQIYGSSLATPAPVAMGEIALTTTPNGRLARRLVLRHSVGESYAGRRLCPFGKESRQGEDLHPRRVIDPCPVIPDLLIDDSLHPTRSDGDI